MRTEAPPLDLAPRAFRGLLAFLWTEVLVQLHETLAMATAMVVQSVLLVFVWILDPSLLGVALVGAIVFSMFAMGSRVLNESAYIRIDHKAPDLYLAGPLSPEGYFLGLSAGILVVYLAPVVLFGLLAAFVVPFTLPIAGLVALVSAAVWLFAASIGYVFATFFRDNRAIWGYSSIFFNVFGVLPPVFYPFALFPKALAPVVLLMPPSAAAALVQHALGATALSGGEILLASVGLVVESVGLFCFAVFWARRTVQGA